METGANGALTSIKRMWAIFAAPDDTREAGGSPVHLPSSLLGVIVIFPFLDAGDLPKLRIQSVWKFYLFYS